MSEPEARKLLELTLEVLDTGRDADRQYQSKQEKTLCREIRKYLAPETDWADEAWQEICTSALRQISNPSDDALARIGGAEIIRRHAPFAKTDPTPAGFEGWWEANYVEGSQEHVGKPIARSAWDASAREAETRVRAEIAKRLQDMKPHNFAGDICHDEAIRIAKGG